MDKDFFIRNEDAILRTQHSLYDSFCSEDVVEHDPYEQGEAQWEMEDER